MTQAVMFPDTSRHRFRLLWLQTSSLNKTSEEVEHEEMRKMSNLIRVITCAAVLFTSTAFADEPVKTQDSPESTKVVPKDKSSAKVRTMRTACWTNVVDCAGVAEFVNNNAREIGCSVYWNNGASGQSNFRLPPGQKHAYSGVRYNDTYACVWAEQAPPPSGTQRSYIWIK